MVPYAGADKPFWPSSFSSLQRAKFVITVKYRIECPFCLVRFVSVFVFSSLSFSVFFLTRVQFDSIRFVLFLTRNPFIFITEMRKLLCTGSKIYLYVFWLLFFYKQLLLPPCPASPLSLSILLILSHSALMTHLRWQPLCLLVLLASANISMCEKHKHHERVSLPSLMWVCVCVYVSGCVCVCLSSCCRLVSMSVQVSTSFSASFTPSVCVENVRVWVTVWLIFIDA